MKRIQRFVIALLWLTITLTATSMPTEADFVVALDGSGDFTTIQAAINAVPSNSDRATIIFIRRGVYNTEKLIIPADKQNVTMIGESREETVVSYHTYNCPEGICPTADAAKWTGDNIRTAATLTVLGSGFRAENLTIRNTAEPVGQAQALTIRADKTVFINCDITGYQDTIYFWNPGTRSYFGHCLIAGRTDYIYGDGIAFFDQCEIRSWGGGWITAPSTPQSQPYGFVFSHCAVAYALGSPRAGDDGSTFRFGRPWHEYPKVAWLYCDITEKLNPQGWGDSWNMEYAASSTGLHLYEFGNTGAGAGMSGRAAWVGLRALTSEEAVNYTVQKVLGGTDNWDPSGNPPLVKQYTWTGLGPTANWLLPANWSPEGIPATGESAVVTGNHTLLASGNFQADLHLMKNVRLNVSGNASATYIAADMATLISSGIDTLSGKIALKDTLTCQIAGNLALKASLSGIKTLLKEGPGVLQLTAPSHDFSGLIHINEGKVEASAAGSLGKGAVVVATGATLTIGDPSALFAKARLSLEPGSFLVLNSDVTTSEFYVGGTILFPGEYTSATHPAFISGTGKVNVGRPSQFLFTAAVSTDWDNPGNYSPALLPLAGETILCEKEMQTTAAVMAAGIIFRNGGSLRLRGNHQATATLHFEEGSVIKYNTGGAGMSLNAPVSIEGNVTLIMESDNTAGSTMTLSGPVSGNYSVTALNNGKNDKPTTGKLLLTGDNSAFTGVWDVSKLGSRYPGDDRYVTLIEANGENSFGKGKIAAGYKSKVIFSHPGSVSENLHLTLAQDAKAVLGSNLRVAGCLLNGSNLPAGNYSTATHPQFFEGTGILTVGNDGPQPLKLPAFPGAEGHGKYVTGGRGGQVIYVTNLNDDTNPGSLRHAINQTGARIVLFKVSGTIQLKSELRIKNGNVTIAGQTAPGDGITLRDYPVVVDAENVIIRYLRFRMGDVARQEDDVLGGREISRVIIDHCSMSWSIDECVSFYQNVDFTLQWCLISESLKNSFHSKGAHGYGGIWGGRMASFHHNLLAHHDSRNPRLGEINGSPFALTDLVDLRNNVIYNWVGNSCYGGEGMNANIVNCYYKPGPGTTKKERIISIDKETETGFPTTGIWGKFYIDGNYMAGSTRATADNWTYGVYAHFDSGYGTVPAADKTAMRLTTPLNSGEITTHTAEKAYERVLEFAGASLVRDTVDRRIIRDVSTGTATYMTGGKGSVNGIIDTQDHVGGWPELATLPAPADSDNDGMPDSWEDARALDKNSPGDAQLTTVDGKYPNIEVYINSLVAGITENQIKEGITTASQLSGKRHDQLRLSLDYGAGLLRINHETRMTRLELCSISGAMLAVRDIRDPQFEMNINHLRPGIYIVRIRDINQEFHSGKFIKR